MSTGSVGGATTNPGPAPSPPTPPPPGPSPPNPARVLNLQCLVLCRDPCIVLHPSPLPQHQPAKRPHENQHGPAHQDSRRTAHRPSTMSLPHVRHHPLGCLSRKRRGASAGKCSPRMSLSSFI